MAYLADDPFLPSGSSGMRPREPVVMDEEITGFAEWQKKFGTPAVTQMQEDQLSTCSTDYCTTVGRSPPDSEMHLDQLKAYGTMNEKAVTDFSEMQVDQPTAYGTMNDKVTEFPRKTRRFDRARMAQKSLFLLWWPAFLGTCLVGVYGLRYWHHPMLAATVLVLTIIFGLSMLLISYNGGWSGRSSGTFMAVNGCCVIFIAFVGVMLGMYCFQTYTKSYEIYRASQYYENVVPSINPGAHRDAGVIKFVAGSHVDVEHSIGIRNGDLYCAAPIVGPESNSYSGFWAVGINCCRTRGGFRCGDVHSQQVRTGLVVLDEDMFGVAEIPGYTKAAVEASGQFGIGVPTKPVFVRWTGDTDLERDRYYHDAWGFVISSAAGLFCFMLVIVVLLSSTAMNSNEGFAHDYYSVDMEVNDIGVAGASKKSKKMKKANRAADPWMSQP